MGYESIFSGSFTPSKPIPDDVADRIAEATSYCVVRKGDYQDDHDGDVGDVVPASRWMKAYYWVEELMRIQRALDPLGIKLSGEVFRKGEDGDDYERLRARKGAISVSTGEVVYGKGRRVTVADVTKYAVLIRAKGRNGRKGEPLGWLGYRGLDKKKAPVIPVPLQRVVDPDSRVERVVTDRPPPGAEIFSTEKLAEEAAAPLNRKRSRSKYCVVSWEERI